MKNDAHLFRLCCLWLVVLLGHVFLCPPAACAAGNRLTHLDDFSEPYNPTYRFPKLTTPQWIGEKNIDAVVIFSIDDMTGHERFEKALRPLLERLKQIDGRAPASIMANTINPAEPHLQTWLKEGVTIEAHTASHPCPILAGGDFAKAKNDYDRNVDLLFDIPNSRPVAFRTPCMDGINSPGPRLFTEIMARTTLKGNFLSISTSVGHLYTPDDPDLPRSLVLNLQGKPRFRKYTTKIPSKHYVNYIENYPYPYVVSRLMWELPFNIPDDYESGTLGNGLAETLEDMKAALDMAVHKKGIYTQCFHPGNWSVNALVPLVDYAIAKHGSKVKFLNFVDVEDRLKKNLLAGQPLRAANGQANGVRLLDLNDDGYMDVVIGNEHLQQTRVWNQSKLSWDVSSFPLQLVHTDAEGNRHDNGGQFGVLDKNQSILISRNPEQSGAWRFDGRKWVSDKTLLAGLELDEKPIFTSAARRDRGVRLRDITDDGQCELLVGNEAQSAVFAWQPAEKTWQRLRYDLPDGVSFVNADGEDNGLRFVDLNEDGADDIVFSNEESYSIHLMVPKNVLGFTQGWSRELLRGQRGQKPELPRIVRAGKYRNNGAWFAGKEMLIQNEDTAQLPDLIQRVSFQELLAGLQPPALSPTQSLATIQVPDDFVIELVAAEPLIHDPIYMDWSEDGRLWVVEMKDYPLGVEGKESGGGTIHVLEDRDGDGKYERSSLFLDNLNYPSGLMCWQKGVLISAAPDLLYAEDTDGDGRADKVHKLFTGFGQGNQQHRFNGFEYGLDNWVYGANGDSGGTIQVSRIGNRTTVRGKRIPIGGRDFRFRPGAARFEPVAGQTQFGRHRDDWGNWFGNNNSVWLWHYWIPERYLKRNSRLGGNRLTRNSATYPNAGRVYPIGRKQQRMNTIGAVGHVTSACSATPNRDQTLGAAYASAVFISEPAQNLIRCEILEPAGASFKSTRINPDQPREFLASSDSWFRPTGMRIGPDGALYIADMYRQFIEHPTWIPDDIEERYDMSAGTDKGRIYRVYPKNTKLRQTPRLDKLDTAGLVKAMDHPNGWQRDMIQRRLVVEGDPSATEPLRKLLARSNLPQARLSALCTLDGLGAAGVPDLIRALNDRHPSVREHAIRISEVRLRSTPPAPLAKAVLARVDDDNLRVRFQLALSLGEYDHPQSASALATLALRDMRQRDILTAIRSSATTYPGEILEALFAANTDLAPLEELTTHLVMLAVSRNSSSQTASLIQKLSDPAGDKQLHAAWQISAFAQLLAELEKKDQQTSEAKATAKALPRLLASARVLVTQTNLPVAQRSVALSLLGRSPDQEKDDIQTVTALLHPSVPDALQKAALDRLGQMRSSAVPTALLKGWPGFVPSMRIQAVDLLFRREEWLSAFLDHLEAKGVAPGDVSATTRQRLLAHSNESLQNRARKLLDQPINPERQQLVESYLEPVAKATGDANAGASLFNQQCVLCHRLRGKGNGAGPDLASIVDRSPETMLIGILDPNRAVEDKYVNYLAHTTDDEEFAGILVEESANSITLVGASGISQTILRKDLASLSSTKLSLMPEGFEHLLTPQKVADLIAYIDASAIPPKTFPGNQPALVRQDEAGALRLRASNAEIYGERLGFEAKYKNLGTWHGRNDRSVWTVQVPSSGSYEVWLHWACPAGEAGDDFRFRIGDVSLTGIVPSTGTWDLYKHAKFGTLELKAGQQRAVFEAQPPLKAYLIDLLEVRLVPANAATPAPAFEQVGSAHTQSASK